MPSSDPTPARRHDADVEYSYRRPLSMREMVPALGVAIGVGVFAFYITRLLLQRTPLEVSPHERSRRPRVQGLDRSARA